MTAAKLYRGARERTPEVAEADHEATEPTTIRETRRALIDALSQLQEGHPKTGEQLRKMTGEGPSSMIWLEAWRVLTRLKLIARVPTEHTIERWQITAEGVKALAQLEEAA